ncbi:unnamed protein product [Musa acuminata subsp. malaccensis]|uniref:ADP/ATP translocase n=1 Tax=Musa acuminata subsp. malaccensis TaxID=214687 RepID=A0A804KF06_MUSAM|nr:unnamed protein product [Musa acuminata subsp. malaccensis]
MFNFKKDKDGHWKWFAGNLASGGAAGARSVVFVYSVDYARTHLANDAKAAKKGGERQFRFNISCVGIMVYRGLYFGMYDSSKPVVLAGNLQVKFWLSVQILLASYSTTFFGERFDNDYPIDTGRRRMMMVSERFKRNGFAEKYLVL